MEQTLEETEELKPLERIQERMEDKIHEVKIKHFNERYPELDPLMCSVLLKLPKESLDEMMSKPELWITPKQEDFLIMGNVTISDPI